MQILQVQFQVLHSWRRFLEVLALDLDNTLASWMPHLKYTSFVKTGQVHNCIKRAMQQTYQQLATLFEVLRITLETEETGIKWELFP